MLSGHDESISHGHHGAGKNFGGRGLLPVQSKDRLFANEHGRGRGLPGNRQKLVGCAGALAGRSRKGSSEAEGLVRRPRRGIAAWVPWQLGSRFRNKNPKKLQNCTQSILSKVPPGHLCPPGSAPCI